MNDSFLFLPIEIFWIPLVKAVVVFLVMLLSVPVMVLAERKIIGRIQQRPGPNRVGLYALVEDIKGSNRDSPIARYAARWFRNGELQTIIDGVKLFLKEDVVPPRADKPLFMIAPMLSFLPAVLAVVIVPFAPDFEITIRGHAYGISMTLADLPIGILFYFAVNSVAVYGIVLAGWASNSKYSLLGGIRATAQIISYEITLGLAMIGVLLIAGSFGTREIVASQEGGLLHWHFLRQPLGFALFLIGGFAETNRLPFDMAEGESELTGGFHTEYSSIRFAMFFMAEYLHIFTFSAILSTLFLGGYHGPVALGFDPPVALAVISGLFWIGIKIAAIFFFFVWVRGTLPRLRYDQLMQLGWKVLFPLAVANVVVTAGVIALGWPGQGAWLFAAGMALIVIADLVSTSMKKKVIGHAS